MRDVSTEYTGWPSNNMGQRNIRAVFERISGYYIDKL